MCEIYQDLLSFASTKSFTSYSSFTSKPSASSGRLSSIFFILHLFHTFIWNFYQGKGLVTSSQTGFDVDYLVEFASRVQISSITFESKSLCPIERGTTFIKRQLPSSLTRATSVKSIESIPLTKVAPVRSLKPTFTH